MSTNPGCILVLTGNTAKSRERPTQRNRSGANRQRSKMLKSAFKHQSQQNQTQALQTAYATQATQALQTAQIQKTMQQSQIPEAHKQLLSEKSEQWKSLPLPGLEDSNSLVNKMEIQNLTPVEVSSVNALSVSLQGPYSPERYFMGRTDFWHRFIIEGGAKYDGDLLLKIVVDTVYPVDIIPVLYRVVGNDSNFLARNCGPAIHRLCVANMSIMLPQGVSLSMRVILGYKHIKDMPLNMQQRLLKVINKRYNKLHSSLDLSNYSKDSELKGLIFCPLSQPRILSYVLRSAGRVYWMKEINLSHNELSSIKTIEVLYHMAIRKLDLSNNQISSIKELEILTPMELTHLNLDHNPLCAQFEDEASYISAVRSVIPTIEVLDGVELSPQGFPQVKRNHMWTEEDRRMADEFLCHYFTLYDSENRRYLLGLYHENALFSLTAHYIPGQNTSSSARLTDYTIESRNLVRISDYAKNMQLLHRGSEDILATLCRLPRSDHDPYSFCVDLTHLPTGVVISVNGVFREPTVSKEPLVRSFNRIFILIAISPTEYQIANEMLHICNATTKQVEDSFKIPKTKIETLPAQVPLNLNESEKLQMAEIFSCLTEMNVGCSKKCLEEASWNIRDALAAFLELYKANQIPVEAFVR